jgi:ATP-binding cassette, subfamily C (CFTR/MRP), member 1
VILAALQVAFLAQWFLEERRTSAAIAAGFMTLAATIAAACLSFISHSRTPGPSLLLSTYLFFSLLCDIPRARTLWVMGYPGTIAGLFYATMGLKVISLSLEETSERRFIYRGEGSCPDEEAVGLINRTLFIWISDLIKQGYSHTLEVKDLPAIDHTLLSGHLWEAVGKGWDSSKSCEIAIAHGGCCRPELIVANSVFP